MLLKADPMVSFYVKLRILVFENNARLFST
jgi:hypothetical protein